MASKLKLKSKKEVSYSEGNDKEHCGNCTYFRGTGKDCDKVRGPIAYKMWCNIWKSARTADPRY